jgi:hypothetical protein
MSEIRSTLDLVMEKTGHLKLSPEERRGQQQAQRRKQLNGLLQKYLDGRLQKERLRDEWRALGASDPAADKAWALETLFARIDPEADNGPLFELLTDVFGIATAGSEKLIGRYHRDLASSAAEAAQRLQRQLAKQAGISGTAVVPNVEADGNWRHEREALRGRLKQELTEERRRLAAV